jgi:hypothetical protein
MKCKKKKKGNNSVGKKPSRRGIEDCRHCARWLLHPELWRQCRSVMHDYRMAETESDDHGFRNILAWRWKDYTMIHIKTTRSMRVLPSEKWTWFVLIVKPKVLNRSLLVFAAKVGRWNCQLEVPPQEHLAYTSGDTSESKHFLGNIRKYNSCFQITSFGATLVEQPGFPSTFTVWEGRFIIRRDHCFRCQINHRNFCNYISLETKRWKLTRGVTVCQERDDILC